jgi:hypothetical protein
MWSFPASLIVSSLVHLYRLSLFFLLGDGNPIISTAVDLNFDLFEKGTKLYRSVVDIRVKHEGS